MSKNNISVICSIIAIAIFVYAIYLQFTGIPSFQKFGPAIGAFAILGFFLGRKSK